MLQIVYYFFQKNIDFFHITLYLIDKPYKYSKYYSINSSYTWNGVLELPLHPLAALMQEVMMEMR